MFLRKYVIVTGLGTLLVLAMPELVVIGMFLLILPGLLLMLMPTAFLYGVVFALILPRLPGRLSSRAAHLLAAGCTIALVLAVPQLLRLPGQSAMAMAREPDLLPAKPIDLAGVIRIERSFEDNCDRLCKDLLELPGVTAVHIDTKIRSGGTYRTASGLEEPVRSKDKPAADFIVTIESGPRGEKNRFAPEWSLLPSPISYQGVTVRKAGGPILLRKLRLTATAVMSPLLVGGEGFENFRFGWERTDIGEGPDRKVDVAALLRTHSNLIQRGGQGWPSSAR